MFAYEGEVFLRGISLCVRELTCVRDDNIRDRRWGRKIDVFSFVTGARVTS